MKALILAGGFGTRLRPLTLALPKPIVPIFERPFLYYQIDLLRQVPEIDEVILSLNYQPDRIERRIGNGAEIGLPIRYRVESEPLGTGGAIKFASRGIEDSVLVFNGDVLTQTNLKAVVRHHHECSALATIVLTPVLNPAAYGLVESDERGNVRRFLEKPSLDQITCNTINAGIYVLEPETFDRIPDDLPSSIERDYFPSLVSRGERFVSYLEQGYWLDIGSPNSYIKAHRDLMSQRCSGGPFDGKAPDFIYRETGSRVSPGAEVQGPCFLGTGCLIESGARIGPESVIGPRCIIRTDAVIERGILWGDTVVEARATVSDALIGESCKILSDAKVSSGAIIGHGTILSEHSHV